MKKFRNLLKKEIKELITLQLIISLLFTVGLFYFIGNLTKTEMRKIEGAKDIYVLDLDKSELSKEVISNLSFANFRVNLLDEKDKNSAIEYAKKSNINLLLIIPEGFGSAISKFQLKEIETYSFIRSFSMSSTVSSAMVSEVLSAINRYLSNNFLKSKFPEMNPEDLKNPIKSKDFVIVKDKIAEGSAAEVSSIVYSQSIFIPIILTVVIIFSSQMVLSAIAMEKQDKTLETLLTVPISRNQIVVAKMMGAGLVGLISAGIYMIGFRSYMGGFTGNISLSDQTNNLIQKLGLQFTLNGYILLGVSLFLAILCALALATILGVLAEDLKSAQGMTLPLTFLVMIPYFLSIFSDINSLSLPLKILVLGIPFTHPFIASQNILLENYPIVFYGILYMLAVFIILIFIAGKIFSTDRVLTMKLRFGRKKILTFFILIFLVVPTFAKASNYNIFAQLNPKDFTISGYVEIDYFNNTSSELKEIYFYLPANLGKEKNPYIHPVLQDPSYIHGFDPAFTVIRGIYDKEGNILDYSLEKGKILFTNYSLEDNYLKVYLPKSLLPGEGFYLKILFSTKFPKAYFGDNSFAKDAFVWRFGWFPQELSFINGEWDKGGRLVSCNFNIELLVPKDYETALGVDEQKEEIINGEWKKVIGKNFTPKRSLPLAISPKYRVYKFPSQKEPEILVYYYPGREYKARILATYAQEIIDKYTSLYGPSGHKRVVIVEGQIEGLWGMTADNLILLGNSVFYSSDLFSPFLLERVNEYLLSHEIAHLWWGIGVGADFDKENWISEALAQYSSIYYFEKKYGAKGGNLFPELGDDFFLEYLKDNLLGEWNLRESQVELPYLIFLKDKWDEPIVKDYWNSFYNGYDTKIYGKAYLLLRALSFEIGEDKFNEVLKVFFERFRGKIATTEDFKNVLKEITQKDFSEFFNTWFYSAVSIDWKILDFSSYKTPDGWNTRVHLKREGAGFLPVEILLITDKGEEIREVYDGKEEDVFLDFKTNNRVVKVVLDPDSMIPDKNRLNNSLPRKVIYTSKRIYPLDAYVIYYDLLPSFSIDLTTGQLTNLSYHIEGYDPIDHWWSLEGFYLQDGEEYLQGTLFQYIRYLPRDDNLSLALLWIQPNYFAGEFSLTKNFWQKFNLGISGNLWQPAYQLKFTLGYVNYGYLDIQLTRLSDIYSLALQNTLHFRTSLPFQEEKFYKLDWSLSKNFLVFPHSYFKIYNELGYVSPSAPEEEFFNLKDWKSFTGSYYGNLKWSLFAQWNLPILRDQETKILNLFIFREMNFNIFTELGGVFNTSQKIDEKGLKMGLGFEINYNFTTLFDLPLFLNIGYAFPIYQGTINPNERGNYYIILGVGKGF